MPFFRPVTPAIKFHRNGPLLTPFSVLLLKSPAEDRNGYIRMWNEATFLLPWRLLVVVYHRAEVPIWCWILGEPIKLDTPIAASGYSRGPINVLRASMVIYCHNNGSLHHSISRPQ